MIPSPNVGVQNNSQKSISASSRNSESHQFDQASLDEHWRIAMLGKAENDANQGQVRRHLDWLIKNSGPTLELWLRHAKSYSTDMDFPSAIRDYHRVKKFMNSADANELAVWYQQRVYESVEEQNDGIALWYLSRLDSLGNSDWRMNALRSDIFFRRNQPSKSLEFLNKATEESGDSRFMIRCASLIAERCGQWDLAANLLLKSEKFEPMSPKNHLQLAIALLKNDDIESYLNLCNEQIRVRLNNHNEYGSLRYLARILSIGSLRESHLTTTLKWIYQSSTLNDSDNQVERRNMIQARAGLLAKMGKVHLAIDSMRESLELSKSIGNIVDWVVLANAIEPVGDIQVSKLNREKVEDYMRIPYDGKVWSHFENRVA